MTTVLVCASPAVESDLCHTLFWRDDLERYVAERTDEASTLALATEPHIVVIDLALGGVDRLINNLRNQALPHPVSIVALSHDPADTADSEETVGTVDTVLSLPASPAWDESLVQVLQVTQIVFMVPLSAWVGHLALRRQDWVGGALVAVGLVLNVSQHAD